MGHSLINDFYYSIFPDSRKYLTFETGETNVLLTAPHGGGIKPRDIPNRAYGNRSGDTYTRRLIQKMINLMDKNPYYLYSDIHRSKVDLNRDIDEAAQGNKKAEKVWKDWNHILSSYQNIIRTNFDNGLYIDIHSHNKHNKFELGYGLSVRNYLDIREGRQVKAHSTLYALKEPNKSEFNTLFGDGSFVDTIEKFGFDVYTPYAEKAYLNGGRNVTKYSGNRIGALQIECPISVLKTGLNDVAYALVNGIYIFQERYME